MSASHPSPEGGQPQPRVRFSLTGRSRAFDPLRQAIRADLADVAEAEHHFAPHYAKAVLCRLSETTDLVDAPNSANPPLASLAAGEDFAVLDTTGGWAWGYRTSDHLVGYAPASAIDRPA